MNKITYLVQFIKIEKLFDNVVTYVKAYILSRLIQSI